MVAPEERGGGEVLEVVRDKGEAVESGAGGDVVEDLLEDFVGEGGEGGGFVGAGAGSFRNHWCCVRRLWSLGFVVVIEAWWLFGGEDFEVRGDVDLRFIHACRPIIASSPAGSRAAIFQAR